MTEAQTKVALDFDAESHTYRVDGVVVPSVTQVLKGGGLIPDLKYYAEGAAERGHAVHVATVLSDEDDLDERTLDPRIHGYVEAWRRFRNETNFEIVEHERRVYSAQYRYAGTLDIVGVLNGRLCIVDKKTGSPGRVAGVQLAAYAQAYSEEVRQPDDRLVVQLHQTGRYTMRFYRERTDFAVFLAALSIVRWKEGGK